jgi:hypothetical protein
LLSAAQKAICRAVIIGLRQSRELGMQAERELFYNLLNSDEVRNNLKQFMGRSKAI